MKKVILAALLLASLSVGAQERKWEHRLYVGAGLMAERETDGNSSGLALKAGYGLSYHWSEQWSLKAGVAVRDVTQNGFKDVFDGFGGAVDGADDDHFTFLDVPVIAHYHIGQGRGSWALGLGPVLSFCVGNETYYIDADPQSPLSRLNKCKTFALGLQPSVTYRVSRHIEIGVEATLGLTNLKRTHALTTGSKRIHDVALTVGWVL